MSVCCQDRHNHVPSICRCKYLEAFRQHEYIANTLKMEILYSSETFVITYKSTQRWNPKDQHRHLHRRENLISHTDNTLKHVPVACKTQVSPNSFKVMFGFETCLSLYGKNVDWGFRIWSSGIDKYLKMEAVCYSETLVTTTRPHDVTSHKNIMWTLTAVKISNIMLPEGVWE
jgi:hypothetical protein